MSFDSERPSGVSLPKDRSTQPYLGVDCFSSRGSSTNENEGMRGLIPGAFTPVFCQVDRLARREVVVAAVGDAMV
jgi:hypothetical protein